MRRSVSRIGSLLAAATAAVAVPLAVAPPSSAAPGDTVTPNNLITYHVSNDCAVWSGNCAGNKWGSPEYSLNINYHSASYASTAYAEMYGSISNYQYSEVAAQGTTYRYYYVFAAAGGSGGADGAGQSIKNNAASVTQCGIDSYSVYYNSGFMGHSQYFLWSNRCDKKTNLDSTLKNNNASQALQK